MPNVEGLVKRLRDGICDNKCRVRDARSGCDCAMAASALSSLRGETLEEAARECDKLAEVASRLRGIASSSGIESAAAHGQLSAFKHAADALRSLPQVQQAEGWIPVSERLPEVKYGPPNGVAITSDDVLLHWENGDISIGSFTTPDAWYDNENGAMHDEPTHWQPLPSPPQSVHSADSKT